MNKNRAGVRCKGQNNLDWEWAVLCFCVMNTYKFQGVRFSFLNKMFPMNQDTVLTEFPNSFIQICY